MLSVSIFVKFPLYTALPLAHVASTFKVEAIFVKLASNLLCRLPTCKVPAVPVTLKPLITDASVLIVAVLVPIAIVVNPIAVAPNVTVPV